MPYAKQEESTWKDRWFVQEVKQGNGRAANFSYRSVMAFWCSWWLPVEFFPRLISRGDLDSLWGWNVTWYPRYPPSCSAVNLPADPLSLPSLGGGSVSMGCTLVPLFVIFPLCFCWGVGLLSCRVKPSGDILVFTVLSWGCPGSSRCTPLLSHAYLQRVVR